MPPAPIQDLRGLMREGCRPVANCPPCGSRDGGQPGGRDRLGLNQFSTAQRPASWAVLCPGNHESPGKRKSGKTRDGNKWLRWTLCQAAWAVTRKKDCYLSAQFKRLAARRGVKRAVMAVSHTMLVIGYHMPQNRPKLPRARREPSGASQQGPTPAAFRKAPIEAAAEAA